MDRAQSPAPAPLPSPKPVRTASTGLDERLRVRPTQSLVSALHGLHQAVQSLSHDIQSLRLEMYALHTDVSKVLDDAASAAEAVKAADHGPCQRPASQPRQPQHYDRSPVTLRVLPQSQDAGPCGCCLRDREAATYYKPILRS